jgi:hypothetical protein
LFDDDAAGDESLQRNCFALNSYSLTVSGDSNTVITLVIIIIIIIIIITQRFLQCRDAMVSAALKYNASSGSQRKGRWRNG